MYKQTNIKPGPGAEAAGHLYREAIALAEAGKFDEALRSVAAIGETGFRLSLTFRNEAMLEIVRLCCEAGQVESAYEIARQMDAPQFQRRAHEVVNTYSKGMADS